MSVGLGKLNARGPALEQDLSSIAVAGETTLAQCPYSWKPVKEGSEPQEDSSMPQLGTFGP